MTSRETWLLLSPFPIKYCEFFFLQEISPLIYVLPCRSRVAQSQKGYIYGVVARNLRSQNLLTRSAGIAEKYACCLQAGSWNMNRSTLLLLLYVFACFKKSTEEASTEDEEKVAAMKGPKIPTCRQVCRIRFALRRFVQRNPQLAPKLLRLGTWCVYINWASLLYSVVHTEA